MKSKKATTRQSSSLPVLFLTIVCIAIIILILFNVAVSNTSSNPYGNLPLTGSAVATFNQGVEQGMNATMTARAIAATPTSGH